MMNLLGEVDSWISKSMAEHLLWVLRLSHHSPGIEGVAVNIRSVWPVLCHYNGPLWSTTFCVQLLASW